MNIDHVRLFLYTYNIFPLFCLRRRRLPLRVMRYVVGSAEIDRCQKRERTEEGKKIQLV